MSNIDWQKYAIMALETEDTDIRKVLLEKSIHAKPNQAWPFYKLIDLLKGNQPIEAIKLFKQSKQIEFSEWYFLILNEYQKLLNIIYDEIAKIESEFELLDPEKITSPFIFLPYIKYMSTNNKMSDEKLNEYIQSFIKRIQPDEDQNLIFNSIINFLSLKQYDVDSDDFKKPVICENIDQKNNNINKILAWINRD